MWKFLTLVLLLASVTVGRAQPAYSPECEQDIAQALQRSTTLQALAQQEREAIVKYFQRELQRLKEERDTLKAQLDQQRGGKMPPPPTN